MKIAAVLTAALALATGVDVAEAAVFQSKQVKMLNGKNFKRLVQGSPKLTLVAFVAPWCGYCKKLAPEYDRAADNLKGLVNLVAMDCDIDENKQFCGIEGVEGFPTLKVYPGGAGPAQPYQGAREAKPIVDYLLSRMPTFVKRATTAKEIESLKAKASDKPISLLFTSSATVTPLYKALSTDFYKTIDFYAAREAKVGKEAMALFGVDKVPTLVLLDGDKVTKYDGPLQYDALYAWLKPVSEERKKAAAAKDEL